MTGCEHFYLDLIWGGFMIASIIALLAIALKEWKR